MYNGKSNGETSWLEAVLLRKTLSKACKAKAAQTSLCNMTPRKLTGSNWRRLGELR